MILMRLLLVLLAGLSLCGQTINLEGTWGGALEVPGNKLRLAVHITRDASGALSGKMDSLDQGAMGMPLQDVVFEGGVLKFALKMVNGTFEGKLNAAGNEIAGTWSQGTPLPLTLRRGETPAPPKRSQVPAKPYPYTEVEVTIPNKAAGNTLAGTLTTPPGKGPFPVVVLISGSGPQDRDETLLGHKPFLVLADHLTRAGIAVLRYDDRGIGKSTGSFATGTSEDFATDAAAAVEFLKVRPEIDPKRIGLCGHSEGGIIAPMVAAKRNDVAFLVLMAGTGVTGEAVIVAQLEAIMKASGAPPEAIAKQREQQVQTIAILKESADMTEATEKLKAALGGGARGEAAAKGFATPWMRYFLTYDPALALAQVKCPVLAVNGELDRQVLPSQNLPPIQKALTAAGNKDFEILTLPKLNHLFQTAGTGAPSEYGTIEETMSPVALEAITKWVRKHTGLTN